MNQQYSAMRSNVSMLGKLLGETIQHALGEEILSQVELIRKLSRQSRGGCEKSREALLSKLQQLTNDELLPVARAFSQFLNLTNVAEQYQTLSAHPLSARHPESLKLVLERLQASPNLDQQTLVQAIKGLSLDLVLTAHPTEITRRTLIHKLVEVNYCLKQLDRIDLPDYERNTIMRRLRQLIAQAWYTDEIRQQRPTPVDEAKWGFAVVENSLWEAVPTFLRDLNELTKTHLNLELSADFSPVSFSSWMGGDRDGNPNVTASITREVMLLSRWKAVDLFLRDISLLISELSMTNCTQDLLKYCANQPTSEPYRFVLKQLRHQLTVTRQWIEAKLTDELIPLPQDALIDNQQLLLPLQTIYQSLIECGMTIIANGQLLDTLRRVRCFGLTLVRLDIRQESTRHTEALSEITHYLSIGDYASWSEEKKQTFLLHELSNKRPLRPRHWQASIQVEEVLETCKIAAQAPAGAIAAYVISMAKNPSDILAVHLLLKEAGLDYNLPVVPLFETLEDLNNSNNVMQRLLSLPWYRQKILGRLMIMIGYSDSAKDAGVLAAGWAQYQAQEALLKTCEAHEVKLTLFHGRGGTIGRGGAPAHAALLSQPPGSLQGGLRVTEQGEMIRFKYGLPEIAISSLSLYTGAILEANLQPPPEPKPEWQSLMAQLSTDSCAMYRGYVCENADFVDYFRTATPEQELGKLPLGSRPAKRKPTGGVETLRAIPWIFAWTQNRLILPAWLGAGAALENALEKGLQPTLEEMCHKWPFFATRIAMLEMVFAKTDPWLAEYYDHRLVAEALWPLGQKLRRQLAQDIKTTLTIANDKQLMAEHPWIAESIALRNVYTDPLNVLQAELLNRARKQEAAGETVDARVEQALMVTITGIAAGMRNTG